MALYQVPRSIPIANSPYAMAAENRAGVEQENEYEGMRTIPQSHRTTVEVTGRPRLIGDTQQGIMRDS